MVANILENEANVDPMGDMMLNFLIDRDKEEPYVDFKETLSVAKDSPFPKIAKDIFAFSNYGGGFILLGFRDRKNVTDLGGKVGTGFEPIGLPVRPILENKYRRRVEYRSRITGLFRAYRNIAYGSSPASFCSSSFWLDISISHLFIGETYS